MNQELDNIFASPHHELLEIGALTIGGPYSPTELRHAYRFDNIVGDGTGQTIAIVDAYDHPNIAADLAAFNANYGLPTTDGNGGTLLTIAKPQGQPAYNQAWAQEIAIDVQWAHAIAPGAKILLVEAVTSGLANLFSAITYAASQPGVSVVSLSWGASEFVSETNYENYFTTPGGHIPVSYVASAGDTGSVVKFPSIAQNVLGVGGTSLTTTDSDGTYGNESGWTKSGGGISAYESKPSYQSSVTQSSTKRCAPDIGYNADSSTGVLIYFTPSGGSGGWYQFGGTSIGAPQIAALIAIANQIRVTNGKQTLNSRTDLLPKIYSMPSTNFHDITSGSTGVYNANAGYDLITGRGTPIADLIISYLAELATNSITGSGGMTAGNTAPNTLIGTKNVTPAGSALGGIAKYEYFFTASAGSSLGSSAPSGYFITITPSGGSALGGIADNTLNIASAKSPVGAKFSGTTDLSYIVISTTSGGTIINGIADVAESDEFIVSAGIKAGASASIRKITSVTVSGGMVLGGIGDVVKQNHPSLSTGLVCGGSIAELVQKLVSGGITFAGIASVDKTMLLFPAGMLTGGSGIISYTANPTPPTTGPGKGKGNKGGGKAKFSTMINQPKKCHNAPINLCCLKDNAQKQVTGKKVDGALLAAIAICNSSLPETPIPLFKENVIFSPASQARQINTEGIRAVNKQKNMDHPHFKDDKICRD